MTYKIYGERKVIDDLNIEVTDLTSANNIINVLQSQNSGDIRYYSEEVEVVAPEVVGESEVNVENGEEGNEAISEEE